MLTRRSLFRRAAQATIAAPLAVVAVHSLPPQLPELEPDPESEPEVGRGTGGDVQITAGLGGITLQRALLGQARGG